MQPAPAPVGMEELVDAAFVAVRFLGEAALKRSAAQLVDLAGRVPFPSDNGVGVRAHRELRDAAEQLQQVDAEDAPEQLDAATRFAAVLRLGRAAVALVAALGVHKEALRVAAADLARTCRDHQVAAEALEKVRSARVLQTETAPWWRRRCWGWRRGAEENALDALLIAQAPGEANVIEVAADFISKALPITDLVKTAKNVMHAADEVGVKHELLDHAPAGTTITSNVSIIIGLGEAATKLEKTASFAVNSLRGLAGRLACECQEHQKGAKAMAAVQDVAAKQAPQKERAQGAPCLGQGHERRSDMLGYAIFGTFALASNISAITDESPRTFKL